MTDDAAQIGLPVLRLLADGERRSGEALATELGMSRAAVWKQIKRLEALGLEVDVKRGVGYRIQPPLDLLDEHAIRAALSTDARARLDTLDLRIHAHSTNSRLLGGERPPFGRMAVCLAEYQSAGRGRRGRTWLAPPGRGLCLSLAWTYPAQPQGIESLGLAAGAAARRALTEQTGAAIGIKWPNDLVVDDRKLGGILVEMSAEGHGACFVVVGIGINVTAVPSLTGTQHGATAAQPIDLASAAPGRSPSRNVLAAALIDAFSDMFDAYPVTGFAAYRDDVVRADTLCGREVTVELSGRRLAGRAIGIAADGRLRVDCGDEIREIVAGDVSVRPCP